MIVIILVHYSYGPPPCRSLRRHRRSVSKACQVCWSAGLQVCRPLREPQGDFPSDLRLPFFMFFWGSFFNPLKSSFGANLVPTWSQNDLKKWAWEGPGRHQKLTSSQKLQNLNPTTIYYTSGMSGTSKRHQFQTLNSPKIDEKNDTKNKQQKND